MEDYNKIKTFFFWMFTAATVAFIFLKYDSRQEKKIVVKNIENSQKGFLRILTKGGGGQKTPTIYGYGYLKGAVDTTIEYKIILGENHEYYNEFKNVKEDDFIPIWQTVDNSFVMERRFATQKETIKWIKNRESQETYFLSKLVAIMWGIYIFIFVVIKWIIGKIIKMNK